MRVDQSGTEIRTRKDRSEFARPTDIPVEVWNAYSGAEQREFIRKRARDAAAGENSSGLREYMVELPRRVASSFPPPDAPPPRAVVRRIVYEFGFGMVSDECTKGWSRNQWHEPPDRSLGRCRVSYVYDPSIAMPRSATDDPEFDRVFIEPSSFPKLPRVTLGRVGIDGIKAACVE